VTKEITIRQKMNCAIALSNSANSTSNLLNYQGTASSGVNYATIPYGASQYLALSEYTTAASMFTNVNSPDCDGFTACSLKP